MRNLPCKISKRPGDVWDLLKQHICLNVAQAGCVYNRAFLALFMLSTITSTKPCCPSFRQWKATTFTLASPKTLATCDRVPGRSSQETVSNLAWAFWRVLGQFVLDPLESLRLPNLARHYRPGNRTAVFHGCTSPPKLNSSAATF
jgi:hypothetical protein